MTATTLHGKLSISLTASDLGRSLKFYTEGLGFHVDERHEENGKLQGVMLSAGDAHIGLSQDDFTKGRDRKKGVGFSLYVETDQDISALAKHAKEARVQLSREAGPLPWGPMAFSATDPDGVNITVMSRNPK